MKSLTQTEVEEIIYNYPHTLFTIIEVDHCPKLNIIKKSMTVCPIIKLEKDIYQIKINYTHAEGHTIDHIEADLFTECCDKDAEGDLWLSYYLIWRESDVANTLFNNN